jgi:hypothetical protein
VVANDLEAANHLANGEEAETLGRYHTCSSELGAVHISDALDYGCRLLSSLGRGLRGRLGQGTGVEDLLVCVLPVGLEGLEGTARTSAHA